MGKNQKTSGGEFQSSDILNSLCQNFQDGRTVMRSLFIHDEDIERISKSPCPMNFNTRALVLCPQENLWLQNQKNFFTSLWETNQLWFIIGGETSSNSHPQASCNPALLRSSGSRGKENLDWSSPSVLMSKISEFGSQDSACNRQITVRSQY